MPKNRQDIPKAERESAVLEQARALFVEHGYRGTSVAAIGRAAGIAAAAVHWYFPTKDDLFAAVIDAIFSEERARIESDPEIAGDPRDELVGALVAMEPYRGLHREAYERMDSSEAVREVYGRMQEWFDGHLLAIISSRAPEGADVGLIADTAQVLLEGLLISVRRLDRPTGALIDLLTDALVAAAGVTKTAS